MKTQARKRRRQYRSTDWKPLPLSHAHRTPLPRRPLQSQLPALRAPSRHGQEGAPRRYRRRPHRPAQGHSLFLQSVEGVHDSLAELYVLLAQDRVSPRRAAVLAYLSSLLLRTLPDDEADAEPEKPTVQFIFGRDPSPESRPNRSPMSPS